MSTLETGSFFSSPAKPAWRRYGLAAGVVIAGVVAREALTPAIGPISLPFIFFFPAVAAAAWYGGLGPAVFSMVLAGFAANWLFSAPVYRFSPPTTYDLAAMIAFVAASVFIAGAIQTMHRARARSLAELAERKRVEIELAGQKDSLATTLGSIGDGVIVTDPQGHVTFLNQQAARLTGWTLAEASGRPLPEVFRIGNEQTGQPAENPVEQVLRLGSINALGSHTVLFSRDGRKIPIEDSAAPIRQPEGPLSGVVLVFRDVTEQRKAQAASARLAAIVQKSGDAIITKNLDGIIQTWNASAERIFGYKPEEIIGKSVTTLIPAELLDEEVQILSRIRQGQPFERLETIRVTKDGRRIPVSLSVSPLIDSEGSVIGASKIIHDISDAVAAREALGREKELLATTLASIGDAVIVTDAEGRVTFLNREAERLTAWTNSEAAGRLLPEVFHIINEETRNPVENPVQKVLRLGAVVGLANHTLLLAKDGAEIPIDDSAAPIRRPNEGLQGVVLVFRDFTEHKRAQKALHDAHAQLADRALHLESLVQERTAKLQEMVTELQHVSYAITHDMRAPLRAMNTFASAVLEKVSAIPQSSPDIQDYCRRIMVGAARLDRLILDSLSYTKAVLQEVPLQPVDLARLIPGLLETYPNLQFDKADIVIENRLPVVMGEESLLTQCFSNLLGNAVKFVPRGVRPKIGVRSTIANGFARITVEDNGIGISPKAQARLFGMFQRLTADYEGTGIGLAIVRKVAERMGGTVGVHSELGKGSRFWVDLRLPSRADQLAS